MKKILPIYALLVALFLLPSIAFASDDKGPKVVVSVAPVHSLVASIMRGVAEPELLLSAGVSPHDYTMKPSNARSLYGADAVFWVGAGLENFLTKPLSIASAKVAVIALGEKHDEEGHQHGEEYHPWLNPRKAIGMAGKIAAALIKIDPAHEQIYQDNADKLKAELVTLDQELEANLAPIKDRPYIVFHDAYGEFEERYGLDHQGAVTLSPDRPVGSKHLQELRQKIREDGVVCVFSEPQFKPGLLKVLTEDTEVKTATLDPLGQGLKEGEGLYKTLMQNLSANLIDCLKP